MRLRRCRCSPPAASPMAVASRRRWRLAPTVRCSARASSPASNLRSIRISSRRSSIPTRMTRCSARYPMSPPALSGQVRCRARSATDSSRVGPGANGRCGRTRRRRSPMCRQRARPAISTTRHSRWARIAASSTTSRQPPSSSPASRARPRRSSKRNCPCWLNKPGWMIETRRPGALFATALGAITLIGPLAIHLFLPVMPAVKTAFAISDALVELTFSITLFTMAIVTLFYGSLSDRYGRRPVLLGGLTLFVIGSALSAFATSVAMLLVGRVIQAVGAGSGLTLSRAIARDAYGPEALVKAIAYLTMAYTIGPMIAPTFGGLLMDMFGWRAAFWFALAASAAILATSYFVLFETRHRNDSPVRHGRVLSHYATLLSSGRFIAYVLQSGALSFAFFAIAAASPLLMKDILGQGGVEYGLY